MRMVMHGPPPLDLSTVLRVMEYLGVVNEDAQERLEMLMKVKTIHKTIMER